MITFGHREDDSSAPGRQRPPNYFSRGVQLKILTMLFLFMGILMLASEARKPKNWRWMWAFDKNAPAGDSDASHFAQNDLAKSLSSKTRAAHAMLQSEAAAEPLVTGIQPPAISSPQGGEPTIGTALTQRDGWSHVLRRLSKAQQLRFQTGMWNWRHQRPLTGQIKAAWPALLQRLDDNWTDYHARVQTAVERDHNVLTGAQKRTSVEIIQASKSLWAAQKAALESVGQDGPISEEQTAVLTELQANLDQRAWAQVEDNTILRAAETEAWYRCWDQLHSRASQTLTETATQVNFVQLFSQPAEFRGHLVRVRGTVKWGYRITSQSPRFGIEGYTVLGLLPHGGSHSPIVVYCTELPTGFPKIGEADPAGKGVPLNEEVEIVGYSFKRWLHRSMEGMTLSPLILGEVASWQPTVRPPQRAARQPMTWGVLLVSALAMAVLATLIAAWVYRSSCWSSTDVASSTRPPDTLPSFGTDEVRGDVAQQLRALTDDEQTHGEQFNDG